MGANSGANGGGEGPANRYQKPPKPKKSVTTRVVDSGKNLITARRKTAYNVANAVPGMEKGLRTNRTDYRNYLSSMGSTPDFLKDDKNLTSFETYDKLINYKPSASDANLQTPLSYADYLAEEKGNYNLKMAGNVGGMNNRDGGGNNNNQQQVKPIILDSVKGPTEIEVSQSQASDAYDVRKTKARGRSSTILTSSRGVRLDDTLTLGKKSLLGA
tara:strand:- start:17 stop:661 length:645 start_codon:yes stop_codon:yes gene_type:complete